MLRLADLRKTTRHSRTEGQRVVYPHFVRDRALAPRIDLAVRYLETMLGRPRRDLDQEVVVQLFGDHKLARCIVACLGASYAHRTQGFAEVLPPGQVAALTDCGMRAPSDLRLWLYRRANTELDGFVGGAERAAFLREAAEALGVPPEGIEALIRLDAPANAILVRIGPVPTADDVIARFNYHTVCALLANAPLVRLSLQRTPADASGIRALCDQSGVRMSLAGRDLVLHGRQDVLDSWVRHGARLARLLALLLVSGLAVRSGEATVAAPGGGQWLFRLDAETLGYLGAPSGDGPAAFAPRELVDSSRRAEALAADFAAVRRASGDEGWSLRRSVAPLVVAGAVIPVLGVCARGVEQVALVPAPTTAAGLARLHEVAARLPLVMLQPTAGSPRAHSVDGMKVDADKRLLVLPYRERADAAALPALLRHAVEGAAQRALAARLEAVLAAVAAEGVLTEARLAEQLGCREEDVPARLALPEARVLREARGIQYVEGFGLCSCGVLARAQAAAADVANLRGDQPAGHAWTARTLGRRLREVTGASEGIECLIAYLGVA
jgi:hypothetical protein